MLEDGVQYAIDIAGGHKTGFYVDQRDNRKLMREIARGKRVLDVCCYTGGFALNAALGGASDVVAVDSSESALDMARKNAELNGVQDKVNFVRADAFDFMQAEIDAGRAGSYDVVVLDPPKFAPTKPALKKAIPKYVGLNKRAMTLLRPGGILITCSCSGAVTQERLLPKIVENASRASRRLRHDALHPRRRVRSAHRSRVRFRRIFIRRLRARRVRSNGARVSRLRAASSAPRVRPSRLRVNPSQLFLPIARDCRLAPAHARARTRDAAIALEV